MDLVLCGKCAWLGSSADLIRSTPKGRLDPAIKTIVKKNNMVCQACPECGAYQLFFKSMPTTTVSIPTMWREPYCSGQALPEHKFTDEYVFIPNTPTIESAPEMSDEEAELDADLVDDIVSAAAGERQEEPKPVTKKRGRPKGSGKKKAAPESPKQPGDPDYVEPNRDKPTRIGCECDTCGKRFMSRVGKETRCPDCLRATMKKLVG